MLKKSKKKQFNLKKMHFFIFQEKCSGKILKDFSICDAFYNRKF